MSKCQALYLLRFFKYLAYNIKKGCYIIISHPYYMKISVYILSVSYIVYSVVCKSMIRCAGATSNFPLVKKCKEIKCKEMDQ